MRKDVRLRRVAALQRRLRDIETGKVARTEARLRELAEQEQALIAFLSRDDGAAAMFPAIVLERLRGARETRTRVLDQLAAERRTLLERSRRVMQADDLAAAARRALEAEEEAAGLEEILDQFVAATVSHP